MKYEIKKGVKLKEAFRIREKPVEVPREKYKGEKKFYTRIPSNKA